MRRLSMLLATGLLAVVMAVPASAHQPPGEATCEGTFTVDDGSGHGLYAPGFGPEKTFDWSINDDTTCTVVTADGSSVRIDGVLIGNGSATGFCGRSTGGPVGTVTLTVADGHSLTFENVFWESAGREFVVSGTTANGETLTAVAHLFGGNECFGSAGRGATNFDIVIEATVA